MSRPRKPRLYIRPDPFGCNDLDFVWFGELGARTWWIGPVRDRYRRGPDLVLSVADAMLKLCWMIENNAA